MGITLVNLTPHEVVISTVTIPPSGTVCRLEKTSYTEGCISLDGEIRRGYGCGEFCIEGGCIHLYNEYVEGVEDLPHPEKDTLYIVSTMVRLYLPTRMDLVSPGSLVRDEAGRVVGCEGLTCQEDFYTKYEKLKKDEWFEV